MTLLFMYLIALVNSPRLLTLFLSAEDPTEASRSETLSDLDPDFSIFIFSQRSLFWSNKLCFESEFDLSVGVSLNVNSKSSDALDHVGASSIYFSLAACVVFSHQKKPYLILCLFSRFSWT